MHTHVKAARPQGRELDPDPNGTKKAFSTSLSERPRFNTHKEHKGFNNKSILIDYVFSRQFYIKYSTNP